MRGFKLAVWVAMGIALSVWGSHYVTHTQNDVAYRQLEDDDAVVERVRDEHWKRNMAVGGLGLGWVTLGVLLFGNDVAQLLRGDED